MNQMIKTIFVFLLLALWSSINIQAQDATASVTEEVEKKPELPEIFKKYEWLTDLVDPNNCNGENITLRYTDNMSDKFILFDQVDKKVMYDLSGNVYCTNSDVLRCEDFYKLQDALESWSCE